MQICKSYLEIALRPKNICFKLGPTLYGIHLELSGERTQDNAKERGYIMSINGSLPSMKTEGSTESGGKQVKFMG